MTQEKLKAFRLGNINSQLSKVAPFTKKKELREERKRVRFLTWLYNWSLWKFFTWYLVQVLQTMKIMHAWWLIYSLSNLFGQQID